jgi:uncharacterized protein YhbP (UPF0306 family)
MLELFLDTHLNDYIKNHGRIKFQKIADTVGEHQKLMNYLRSCSYNGQLPNLKSIDAVLNEKLYFMFGSVTRTNTALVFVTSLFIKMAKNNGNEMDIFTETILLDKLQVFLKK